MTRLTKISYYIFFGCLIVIGVFKLATPFLAVLFSFFALNHIKLFNRSWVAILLFVVIVALVFYGFIYFVKGSLTALPAIAEKSIPLVIDYAEKYGVQLPFSDVASLKAVAVKTVKEEVSGVAQFAEITFRQLIFIIIGLVVSISIFLNGQIDLNQGKYKISDNLYSNLSGEVSKRFSNFYQSFSMVMGAQLTISAINTAFTGIFVYWVDLPYSFLVVALTFLCGLLPIVGNVISNTIIFGIAITVSLKLAVSALLFLIVLHKFEYFLNSKIVGGRIRNPMWLTLLSLVVGERLMGIQGMILAPVFLHYLKLEGAQIKVSNS